MTSISTRPVFSSNWLLFLVASVHLAAALSHFLLSVVSKYVARDIHYGSQACVPRPHGGTVALCGQAMSNETCLDLRGQDGQQECDWDYTGLGLDYQLLAGPSFMAVYTTTSILWGVMADRCNRMRLLAFCSAVFGTAMVLTAFATKFWHLVLLRMVMAAGVAGISPIVPGIIFDAFSERHRALAMGFFHWGIYLGGGLSNAIGKSVTDLHIFSQGWRGSFLVSGIPGIVLAFLMLATGEDPPRTHKGHESEFHCHTSQGHPTNYCRPSSNPRKRSLNVEINANDWSWDNDEDQDIVEYDANEAQVLITPEKEYGKSSSTKIHESTWKCCLDPSVILIGLGACIRQAAGYTWGYNSALYYQREYPEVDASWWLTWITIFGGTLGVIFGGFLSDRLVSSWGLSARALVLAMSQLLAFPFAFGTLWCDPPASYLMLLVGYFFAEMWYGVLFAILVELLPSSIRSLGMAVALFVINNFGGNVPVVVSPLSKLFSYRAALTILYPGSLLTSSFLFFLGYISISRK